MSDYYEFLGVPRDASKEEIRKAFRGIAQDFHPDRKCEDPDAAELYRVGSEAYETLSDDDARRAYDAALAGQAVAGGGHGLNLYDILDGLGIVTGLFMEVTARAKAKGKTPKGACPTCFGAKSFSLQLGPLALEKGCENCGGTGKAPVAGVDLASKLMNPPP